MNTTRIFHWLIRDQPPSRDLTEPHGTLIFPLLFLHFLNTRFFNYEPKLIHYFQNIKINDITCHYITITQTTIHPSRY